eukprot:210307-Karenia_brevis.AAC.1
MMMMMMMMIRMRVIKALMGSVSLRHAGLLTMLQRAHATLQEVVNCFHVSPPLARQLAQHVLRADNSAADSAANSALDDGNFAQIDPLEHDHFLSRLAAEPDGRFLSDHGILISFDGAS